jgi:hypothetical protein
MGERLARWAEPFRFYGRVIWRALRDTWAHIVRHLLVGVVVGFFTFGAQCATEPKGVPCDVSNLEAGLIGVGIWLGLVLLYNLLLAPVRLFRERTGTSGSKVRLLSDPVTTPGSVKSTVVGTTQEIHVPMRWRFLIAEATDGIMLVCQEWHKEVPEGVMCRVQEPDGSMRTGELHRSPGSDSSVRCVYPDDFPEAQPTSGPCFVHWLQPTNKPGTFQSLHDPIDFTIQLQ